MGSSNFAPLKSTISPEELDRRLAIVEATVRMYPEHRREAVREEQMRLHGVQINSEVLKDYKCES